MEHKLTNSKNLYKIQASGFLLLASYFLFLPSMVKGEEKKDIEVPKGMVFVKGGCYQMGDTFGNGESNEEPKYEARHHHMKGGSSNEELVHNGGHHHLGANEKPVHEVCVDDFYIGKYEVTLGEFREFVNVTGYRTEAEIGDGCYGWSGSKWEKSRSRNWRNPGFSQDDSHPVSCVSWNDANEFIKWLNKKLMVSKANPSGKYRLPTEAEWEYAARSGGRREKYSGGDDLNSIGWYKDNSGGKTHPIGQKNPNGLGLYDMTGNVWEWVQDWYDENYYNSSPKNNPQGPTSGSHRIHRGGSWYFSSHEAQVTSRHPYTPDYRCYSLGFRITAPVK